MMTLHEFIDETVKQIKRYLPEAYMDAEVSVHETLKNNGQRLNGLVIAKSSSVVSPAIYLEGFYGMVKEGKPFEEIMQAVADARVSAEAPDNGAFKADDLLDYGNAKEHILAKLVNHDANMELLNGCPNRKFLDLAVLYYVELKVNGETGYVLITNEHLNCFGITENDLHETALMNTFKKGHVCDTIVNIMISIMCDDLTEQGLDKASARILAESYVPAVSSDGPEMFVLTNSTKHYGAVAVLNTTFMDDVCDQFGADSLYILPSSVHEVIIVGTDFAEPETLKNMVTEINGTEVSPLDRLSDSIYMYEKGTGLSLVTK